MKTILLAFSFGLCLTVVARAEPVAVPFASTPASHAAFLGFGVQWSAYPWFDITEDDWQRVFQRLDFMRVPIVRCMLRAYYYCDGFDAQGNPIYNWNSNRMQKLYRLLDYCQSHNVKVIIGEWDSPAAREDREDMSADKLQAYSINEADPRWARLIGDLLEHLTKSKKYTCLYYYNYINEPNGTWSGCANFDRWKKGINILHQELAQRGLKIRIVGPDEALFGNHKWLTRAVDQCSAQLGVYDVHVYAKQKEIESGSLENQLRTIRVEIDAKDPEGSRKPFLMCEVGLARSKLVVPRLGFDSQPQVYDFNYGVWMADYNVQCVRAGMQGTIAWMLDDAMHIQSKDSHWPDVTKVMLKRWGFFNSMAEEMGQPEDAALRPWYYTWSLMSRCFPPGCEMLSAPSPQRPGLRLLAARIPSAGKSDYSCIIVNDSDEPCEVCVTLPVDGVSPKVHRFNYFADDRPVDAQGFPTVKATLTNIDFRQGVTISLPTRGVVILTTLSSVPPKSVATHY